MALGVAAGSEHPLLKDKRRKAVFANIIEEPSCRHSSLNLHTGRVPVSTAVYVPTVQTEFQAGRLAADAPGAHTHLHSNAGAPK